MADKVPLGGSIIGVIFLGLGLLKFLQGDDWVVWILLGVLFGGVAGMKILLGKGKAG